MKKSLTLMMTTIIGAQTAFAQFEDFPPPPPPVGFDEDMPAGGVGDNFNDFEPAPNKANSGGGSFGGSNLGSSIGNPDKSGILTQKQKNKFNKAGPEDITNENFPETIESFDFKNVEIQDLAQAISELVGKNFIIDPGVRGKISIIAPSKITVAEAYKAFLSALAINGFTVVPSGSFMKIKSSRNAQRDSIETFSGSYYPNSDQMITRIIHLKYISAEQVNRDLRILPSKDGEMSVYPATNSIILSDYGANIDRVMKIINQLDIPGFEEQLEVIPVKYAKSKDLADLVDKIINKGEKKSNTPSGTFSAGVPRFSRSTSGSNNQSNSYYMAIPDDRTNSIIIVGSKSGIDRVKKLIAQLDFQIRPEDTGGVNVYNVKYGDAEKIAQTLSGVAKDAAPKPAAGGGLLGGFAPPQQSSSSGADVFGGDVKITADKNTNSLIITASKQDYQTVLSLLAKIDIPRDQVFVEAIIMEMSVTDGNSWNVGYYKYADGGGKVGFNGGVNIADFLSPTAGQGTVLAFGQGKTVSISDPTSGKTLEIPNLVSLVNFLKTVKKANILSTPQIMTLDNQEGEIEVGDRVATGLSKTTGTNGSESVTPTFEDATIKLNIKPFISPNSDSIRMEIKQQVQQLANVQLPKAFTDNSQPLAKRNIKTNIVVNNGETAILGGLMREQEIDKTTKVPLLGDIPILGWFFKSNEKSKEKVNMLVFLTPKIIRNSTDQKTILSKKLDERLDFVKTQGGRDPFGKTLDALAPTSTEKK